MNRVPLVLFAIFAVYWSAWALWYGMWVPLLPTGIITTLLLLRRPR